MAPGSGRGLALVDVLAAMAIAVLAAATTIPVVAGALERERGWVGAQYLAARVAHAQLEALRRGVFVALRFQLTPDDTTVQMFADGNGNGVLTQEIGTGVDVAITPPDRIGTHAHGVSLRINQRVLDAGGSTWLDAGSDPLRIGSTSLVSCAPTGSVTGGTLYLASSRGPQFAVRITGSTGRVRVLRFEPVGSQWWP